MKNLLKHIREFQRYVRNNQYEITDNGSIYFSNAKALLSGTYEHGIAGDSSSWVSDSNLVPTEGQNHFLDVVMRGTAPESDWYIALYSAAYTPTATLTASNFTATASEITSASEGYSQATRVLWQPDAVDTVNSEVTNDATPAVFSIVTASSLTVNGIALLSASAKGSQLGVLASASQFSATRNLANGDDFTVKYKMDLDAA